MPQFLPVHRKQTQLTGMGRLRWCSGFFSTVPKELEQTPDLGANYDLIADIADAVSNSSLFKTWEEYELALVVSLGCLHRGGRAACEEEDWSKFENIVGTKVAERLDRTLKPSNSASLRTAIGTMLYGSSNDEGYVLSDAGKVLASYCGPRLVSEDVLELQVKMLESDVFTMNLNQVS